MLKDSVIQRRAQFRQKNYDKSHVRYFILVDVLSFCTSYVNVSWRMFFLTIYGE